MVTVRFIRSFRTPGGPLYVPGDTAALSETMANEALKQGAALRVQDATYGAALDGPSAHTMITEPSRKKG
jgi:hypothetical protein